MCCRQVVCIICLFFVSTTVGSFDVVSTTNGPTVNTDTRLKRLELQSALIEEKIKLLSMKNNPSQPVSLSLHFLTEHPKDCKVHQERGALINGLYQIQPDPSSDPFLVFCDMQARGGGWTYLMNRYDGTQNFDLTWSEYREGFGNLNGEFWLGLEKIHKLTESTQLSELLIELVDWENNKVYALYSYFKISSESDGYRLKLSDYSGNAGDSLLAQVNQKFSTKDRDQDSHNSNCASTYNGGWWYAGCFRSKLTGKYLKDKTPTHLGIHWDDFHPIVYSLKQVRIIVKSRELWK